MGAQQFRQLLAPRCAVFAGEAARLERRPVLNDVLHQFIVLALPVPGLEGDAPPLAGLMDIGRGIGRFGREQGVVIADAGDEDAARCDAAQDALHSRVQIRSGEHMRQGVIHSDDDVEGR